MDLNKRNQEHLASKLLDHFPAISIVGARQAGKTTLAKQLKPGWRYLDMEKPVDFDMISRDPVNYFRQFPKHIILDEAQLYPEVFDVLRGVIDHDRNACGRFILTGSSSPELLKQVSESLAGRIATIEIGTLKANEYYQTPLSKLYDLFKAKLDRDKLVSGEAPLSNEQMQWVWLKGGYPEPTLKADEFFYQQWMENYFLNYVNRDIARLFPRLNKIKYQRFVGMLSKLSSTIINKSDLGRALEISEGSAREYLKIAEGTFLWRELLSWENNIIKSIIKMPKGYIRDTGLLHYLLGINDLEQLYAHPIIGQSFEGYVVEEILKGLNAIGVTNWKYYYFRTRKGNEVDLILKGYFGILPIEIKYGSSVQKKNLRNLSYFIAAHGLDFGLVINQSEEAMWLTDKIYQIPVGWL